MELREWAEAILRGATLADKLLHPGSFSDLDPGLAWERAPASPGRSGALRPSSEREAPPPLERLEDEGARALVLHSFANHELQALELQALALLRFPDAPAELRREIAATAVEEQAHLGLYLERCRELGVDLGDAPLSRYLWDALAGMERPLDYVTGMALTFEQANLDFAWDFGARLRALGDLRSAAILERVYEEEIGHVRLGATWLKRLVPGVGDWEGYRGNLPAGLTPRRARGSGPFQREGRRAAGLSERFLAELETSGGSRGRPPALLWFRAGAERALAPGGGPRTPPRAHAELEQDLSASLVLLARDDDLVVVPRAPSLAWRQTLSGLGLARVEWIEASGVEVGARVRAALGPRTLGELRPWAWDPLARRALAGLGAPPLPAGELGALCAKPWGAERLGELLEGQPSWRELCVTDPGRTCASWEEVVSALAARGGGWRVVKAPFASSGEGLRRVGPGEEPDVNLRGWVERALAQGAVRVEPWHARLADLSLVFEVAAGGLQGAPEVTAFRTDERGRYRGHWIGEARRFCEPEVLRLLHEARPDAGGASGLDVLAAAAALVGRRLAEAGYRGPAGVDALAVATPAGPRLQPLLEVNARATFGHWARAVARRLERGRVGVWELWPRARWERAGCANAAELAARLEPARGRGGRLEGGVLCTNDPSQAEACLGLLAIARSPGEALALLPS